MRPTLDGSLVDAAMDDAEPVSDDAHVLIAHPIELGDASSMWSEHLGNFEVTQPFDQLERAVYPWGAEAEAFLIELPRRHASRGRPHT